MTIMDIGIRRSLLTVLPLVLGMAACSPAAEADAPASSATGEASMTDAAALATALATADGESPSFMVFKTASCGCCAGWVEHLEDEHFDVEARDVTDLNNIKRDVGVPTELASCHTALVGGYVIEGHVPAEAIRKLLAEHPDIAGLAVPGMPVGSPGMEGPNAQPYMVYAFDRAGKSQPFMEIDPR